MFDSICNFFNDVICAIGGVYNESQVVRNVILGILSIFTIHNAVYIIVGFFFTRKFQPAEKNHKYAILIAARNEEAVIGNLLKSISRQDYPKELITTFVVADNCTDNTAKIARNKGFPSWFSG